MRRIQLNAFAERVDGLVLPLPFGGHPALDFCNTRAGWDDPRPGEYLETYDHLAVWAAANGLIEPRVAAGLRERADDHPRAARWTLRHAISFRDSLYSVWLDRSPGADWDALAEEAGLAAAAAELELRGGHAEWVIPPRTGLRLPVLATARAAADLLSTTTHGAVRACPGSDCGWLFLDRTGRRRWCTMAICGNRAKARRHYARHRSGPS
ncbi:MAG: CGNR zinc finger domain-containing protein [Actinomycetota bacterium]